MDKEIRRRFHNMLVAALADKQFVAAEKAYLEQMREELGVTREEANQVIRDFKENRGGYELSGSADERKDRFREIIGMMLADGVIDTEERRALHAIAKHLGLSPTELKNMILDEQRKHPPKEVEGEVHGKSGVELLSVPAGRFFFGDWSVGGRREEAIEKPYRIGKYPVTNEQWRRFEEESGYQGRQDFGEHFGRPRQPVVGISYHDALAFCKWAGLRLLTEMQWERAGRGTDGRQYPWGNEFPSAEQCVFGRNMFDSENSHTAEVGTCRLGISPVGCHDMAGLVDEWCMAEETDVQGRVPIRGGNWLSAAYALDVYYHNFRDPETRANTLGFRVVES